MNPRDRIDGARGLERGHLGPRREATDWIEEEAGDIRGYAGSPYRRTRLPVERADQESCS